MAFAKKDGRCRLESVAAGGRTKCESDLWRFFGGDRAMAGWRLVGGCFAPMYEWFGPKSTDPNR